MGLMQPRSELVYKDVPSEDYKLMLHKYKESTNSIAYYWWATRFAQIVPPTSFSSSLRFLQEIWQVVMFFFFCSLFFDTFSLFLFPSPTSLMPTRYMN